MADEPTTAVDPSEQVSQLEQEIELRQIQNSTLTSTLSEVTNQLTEANNEISRLTAEIS